MRSPWSDLFFEAQRAVGPHSGRKKLIRLYSMARIATNSPISIFRIAQPRSKTDCIDSEHDAGELALCSASCFEGQSVPLLFPAPFPPVRRRDTSASAASSFTSRSCRPVAPHKSTVRRDTSQTIPMASSSMVLGVVSPRRSSKTAPK